MLTALISEEDKIVCNEDETYQQTAGKYIGKEFAETHGLAKGKTVIRNGKKVVIQISEKEGEEPLEMPTMNFGAVEKHHRKIHRGMEEPLDLPTMNFDEKHHKKMHSTFTTQVKEEEEPLELPSFENRD